MLNLGGRLVDLTPEKLTKMIEKVTLEESLRNNKALLQNLTYTGPSTTLNDVNVDDIVSTGRYFLSTGITGANEYTYLIVLTVSYNITQINYSKTIEIIRIRNRHNGEWTAWKNLVAVQ